MSGSMYWKPRAGGERVPQALKSALQKRYKEWPRDFDYADQKYLEGLCDAGVEGAADLIDAITTHGTITVYIEY
jgi:hypothetical protein